MRKCLLCGWELKRASGAGELDEADEVARKFEICSHCENEAAQLDEAEKSALRKLQTIQKSFEVWSWDKESVSKVSSLPQEQPARIFPGIPLYLGDLSDAFDVQNLRKLGIGCVVNLCADKIQGDYKGLPQRLARARIHQLIMVADDARNFDIISVAENCQTAVHSTLQSPNGRNGVLIHCWAGCNRSAAVAVAFLVTQYRVPLFAAVSQTMQMRGQILTNQSFRKQLVCHCWKNGFDLEGENVPRWLLQKPESERCDDVACSDPEKRHRRNPPADTPAHGLRFAVREGCLKCVKYYIEQGVDPETKGQKYSALDWATWKLDRGNEDYNLYRTIFDCLKEGRVADAGELQRP
ncbi:unnamed protein product [Durusdinium trenchii]|uniref:protein-tyrosine-phosphatase n=1 Tax=Durusdinium trenchii TaxID=1381693 RepID=A0ABP0QR03_9DINO